MENQMGYDASSKMVTIPVPESVEGKKYCTIQSTAKTLGWTKPLLIVSLLKVQCSKRNLQLLGLKVY